MQIYNGIESYDGNHATCLTTGTFDGLHVGHMKILGRLNEIAKSEGLRTILLTFHPHPRKVLFPDDHGLRLLTTMEEKLALLENAGIDDVIVHPFSKSFSRYDSIQYVRDLLVGSLKMKHMVIGYDHHFGRNREGDIEQLREMAPIYDFKVTEIAAKDIDNINVSSTKIRQALEEGEVSVANSFLGYPYSFTGRVVDGMKRGKDLGFPTANLHVEDDTKLVPKEGVYAVDVLWKNQSFKGMMNIGVNPTFDNGSLKTIEVNIFDFDQDLYGNQLTVFLKKFLRSEERFSDVEALITQMNKDRQDAMAV
ncbi:MAG: bifunctional riboflavin kinase/FAD synthetase [Salibacteraceae bacterium]